MKALSQLLIVLGFCVAAIGAAGFDRTPEPEAWPLFGGGLVALAAGAFLAKQTAKAEDGAAAAQSSGRGLEIQSKIEVIRDMVVKLDDEKEGLSPNTLCERIDSLLRNEYFDLASNNEDIAKELGFNDYARVWDGIAVGERLLARVWSISTDGFHEEALKSLPDARRNLERAASAAAAISAG